MDYVLLLKKRFCCIISEFYPKPDSPGCFYCFQVELMDFYLSFFIQEEVHSRQKVLHHRTSHFTHQHLWFFCSIREIKPLFINFIGFRFEQQQLEQILHLLASFRFSAVNDGVSQLFLITLHHSVILFQYVKL